MLDVVLGLTESTRSRRVIPIVITIGMVLGISASLITSGTHRMTGFYIYLPFAVMVIIYGLFVKNLKAGSRVCICIMTIALVGGFLWIIKNWSGVDLALLLLIMSLALMAFVEIKINNKRA